MAGDYLTRNLEGVHRLRRLVGGLADPDLLRPIESTGWSVALAHLAFWDRYTLARWDRFDRHGTFDEIPDVVWDFVNAAALEQWRALTPRLAAQQALDAAAQVMQRIERLSPEAVSAANNTSRLFMLDRTVHWYPHLDQVNAVLG